MKVRDMNKGDLKPIRPEPINPGIEASRYNREIISARSIDALIRGEYILIEEYYSDGLALLHDLHLHLNSIYPNKSYLEQREFRSEYNRLSNQILAEVKQHKLNLMKAPAIGWLEILYPETNHFLLPFTKIQGLNRPGNGTLRELESHFLEIEFIPITESISLLAMTIYIYWIIG